MDSPAAMGFAVAGNAAILFGSKCGLRRLKDRRVRMLCLANARHLVVLCLVRNIHNDAAEHVEGNADDAEDADTAADCIVTYYLHGYGLDTIYGT